MLPKFSVNSTKSQTSAAIKDKLSPETPKDTLTNVYMIKKEEEKNTLMSFTGQSRQCLV